MPSLVKVIEGSIVQTNLEDGRKALGVLARVESKRKPFGIFVYFYGPFLSILPSMFSENYLLNKPAITRLKTSAIDIYNGKWTIVGTVEPWNRDNWEFPNFYETNPLNGETHVLTLDEKDQITPLVRRKTDMIEGADMNILYGPETARKKVSALVLNLDSIVHD